METYYGQDRKNYHTFRLSDEEEVIFKKLMDKYGYTSISSFIRDAILDRKLKVVVYQHPVKYDHTHSIRQLMTNIMTLDKRWIRDTQTSSKPASSASLLTATWNIRSA